MKNETGIRRGLTSYGDDAFSLFLRKAFIKAMGYSDEMLERPFIVVTNTFSDYNPCHGNVPQLIEAVKRGVLQAGGCGGPDWRVRQDHSGPVDGGRGAGRSLDRELHGALA